MTSLGGYEATDLADPEAMARAREAIALPWTPAHLAFEVEPAGWFAFPPWLQYLNEWLADFLLDPNERFGIVEAPVRHGKTRMCSVWGPAWYLGRFPDKRVKVITYSQTLSNEAGRDVRSIIVNHGERLFGIGVRSDSAAVDDWRIRGHKGGMMASPLSGTITGTGGDLIVIDDPVKDPKDVDSKKKRDDRHDWFKRVVRNRLEPGGKMLVVMARWHMDDLAARLQHDDSGDHWEVVHLPALAEPSPQEYREAEHAGTVVDLEAWRDVLGRRHGEALWPERYSEPRLRTIRRSVGPGSFAANFQQVPTEAGDEKFPKAAWVPTHTIPRNLILVRRWDMGSETGDWTAGALLGIDPKNAYTYVLDIRRQRLKEHEEEDWIVATAAEDRATASVYGTDEPQIVLEQEPGSSGKKFAATQVRDLLAGYPATAKPSTGAKETEAKHFAGQQQAGNVYLLERERADGSWGPHSWWDDFKEEASEFPNGANDDMIDAASKGYNDLVELLRERRRYKSKVGGVARRQIGGAGRPGPGGR